MTQSGREIDALIELRLSDGATMILDTKKKVVVVRCAGANGCLAIIKRLGGDDLKLVMVDPPSLIGCASSE